MSTNMIHCPYHSTKWRSISQSILNQTRTKGLLKPQQIRRFPAAVCACPGKETKTELSSLPTKEDLTAWVDSLNGSTPDKIYPPIQRLLKAADKEDSSEAYRQILYRMLSVVYLVYHNKNSFLDPPPPKTDTAPEKTVPEKLPKVYKEEVFSLDIPVTPMTYIGTFIGKGGAALKALCLEYGVTGLQLGDKIQYNIMGRKSLSRMSYIESSPVRVCFKYETGNEKAAGFRKALEDRAKTVCEKRQKHYETVKNYNTARKNRAREGVEKTEKLKVITEQV